MNFGNIYYTALCYMQRTSYNKLGNTETVTTKDVAAVKQPSILFKKSVVVDSKLTTIPLYDDIQLNDEHSIVGKLTVPESGDYSYSLQLCLQHNGSNDIFINFLQYGICVSGELGNGVFESLVMDGKSEQNFIICKVMSGFMKLEADTDYSIWVNLNSTSNSNYKYVNSMSKLHLCKL